MPYSIRKHPGCPKSKPLAVVKKSNGKKIGCHATRASARKQIAAMVSKELQSKSTKKKMIPKYQGKGPALMAVAVTSKPHLRQRGHEIKIVEIDGAKLVRVPLMRKGIYSHPWVGKMVFDDEFFETMIENHGSAITDYPVALDFRHTDSLGSLAFLDREDGGRLEMEGNWLVAHGPPTDEESEKIINSRKWRFSSPEFHPDYESNLLKKLSDGQKYITLEKCIEVKEGESMSKKVIKLANQSFELEDNGNGFLLTEEAISALEVLGDEGLVTKKTLEDAQGREAILEARITELEQEEEDDADEPEMSEAARVKLEAAEARIQLLETERTEEKMTRLKEQVAVALQSAREMTVDGYGYTKQFLDLIQSGLMLGDFKDKSGSAVKLELGDDGMASYFRNLLKRTLEIGLERVPRKQKTESEEIQLEGGNGQGFTSEELDAEIEEFEKF